MTSSAVPVSRAVLARAGHSVLKHGHGFKPDVLLVDPGSGPMVVKDYAGRGGLVRRWLGPWLVRREWRVRERLAGVAAVPGALGVIDRHAFALEFRPGEPLSRALARRLGPAPIARFLSDLDESVAQMYACGVVHLDLRHRDNILLGPGGKPVLIDFAAAMSFRPGSFWYRWYRPTVRGFDERALRKWRERLRPDAPESPRTFTRRFRAWRRLRARPRRSRSADRAG